MKYCFSYSTRQIPLACATIMVAVMWGCSSLNNNGLLRDDHLIVPGERIGPIHLGMSEEDLLKVGFATESEPHPVPDAPSFSPGIRYWYKQQSIVVYVLRSTRRVVAIEVGRHGDCVGYRTAEGVSCNSNIYNIIGAFGECERRASDHFGPKIRRCTYLNAGHVPRSVTVYEFSSGSSMADHPSNTVQNIGLYEGAAADYYAKENY